MLDGAVVFGAQLEYVLFINRTHHFILWYIET
jgi:hypothetical protein